MDKNRWSHPAIVALSRNCLDGVGWLHSSQISAIRHNNICNPGPRTFVAIAELNKAVHAYATRKRLIPNTKSDELYLQAYAITEDGSPPEPGWWFEVFVGYRVPKDVPLDIVFMDDAHAASFSRNYARIVRKLLADNSFDLLDDLDRVIRAHYPAGDAERVRKLVAVIMQKAIWSSVEAEVELPALTAFTAELGGPSTQEDMLRALS